ncbi:hypothetical protein PVNG_04459 [Plasmodium vivax North Korean]|uniref:VIR protein n=1 Tax=Plasmodium vivax North Korean TaxID=1035514 RepID=A0A0J9U4Z6_PLAVI|nr:hypothetical protein PVNG_04459 [Plasmodium vivax North Korean]
MTANGRKYLAESTEALKSKQINTSRYSNLFEEITRHLGGDHAFSQYGNIPSCIYVNYWLNKEVKKNYDHLYNDESFNIFNKFINNYSEIRYKKDYNICKEYIKLLDYNESQRMNILYLLYDYYDQLKLSVQFNNLEQKCTNLGIIFHHYQNILSSHEKYKDIISQLESLKNLILKIESKHNLRCSSTMSKIVFPKEESSDSVKHPEAHSMKISLPDELTKHQSSVLEHNRGGTSTMGVLGLKGTIDSQTNILQIPRESAEIEQPRREQPEIKPLEIEQEEVSLEQASLPKATFTRYTTEEPEDTHASIRSLDIIRAQNNDTGLNVSPYPGDREGLMKKINTVISDTLGSVDPAPVLGVSGGMGILFVLFKVFNVLNIYLYVYNTFK